MNFEDGPPPSTRAGPFLGGAADAAGMGRCEPGACQAPASRSGEADGRRAPRGAGIYSLLLRIYAAYCSSCDGASGSTDSRMAVTRSSRTRNAGRLWRRGPTTSGTLSGPIPGMPTGTRFTWSCLATRAGSFTTSSARRPPIGRSLPHEALASQSHRKSRAERTYPLTNGSGHGGKRRAKPVAADEGLGVGTRLLGGSDPKQ